MQLPPKIKRRKSRVRRQRHTHTENWTPEGVWNWYRGEGRGPDSWDEQIGSGETGRERWQRDAREVRRRERDRDRDSSDGGILNKKKFIPLQRQIQGSDRGFWWWTVHHRLQNYIELIFLTSLRRSDYWNIALIRLCLNTYPFETVKDTDPIGLVESQFTPIWVPGVVSTRSRHFNWVFITLLVLCSDTFNRLDIQRSYFV